MIMLSVAYHNSKLFSRNVLKTIRNAISRRNQNRRSILWISPGAVSYKLRVLSNSEINLHKTHIPFILVHPSYPTGAQESAFDAQKAESIIVLQISIIHFVLYHEYTMYWALFRSGSLAVRYLMTSSLRTFYFYTCISDYNFWKRGWGTPCK